MNKARLWALLAMLAGCTTTMQKPASTDQSNQIDVARIFAGPALDGAAPFNVKIAPDGSQVGFLRGSAAAPKRLDLWVFDPQQRSTRLLVSAESLIAGGETLSDEERARRERQRISALSGIVDYHFSPTGEQVLFPLGGLLYLYDLASATTRQLTQTGAAIDPKFSPSGRYVSFVRDRELMAIDLIDNETLQLSSGATATVANGLAEFVAQEEMDRDTGYWWAPDESAIAYLQFDESPVDQAQRYEVYADDIKIVTQRYPATGTPNVINRLAVVSLSSMQTRWLNLGTEADIYIPRVDWTPDARALFVQRQSRNQQTLELLSYAAGQTTPSIVLTETHDTWLNLYDDLTFLPDGEAFIWSSARDGQRHLYLYEVDGTLVRQVTSGEWSVVGDRYKRAVVHADHEAVHFIANFDSPTERHLYRVALDKTNDAPMRLTTEKGWHSISFATDGMFYLDSFSADLHPPSVTVHDRSGQQLGAIEMNALDQDHPYAPFVEQHATMQFGTLAAEDGQTLHYYIRKPAAANASKPHPAIVFVYGGPGGQRVRNAWGNHIEQTMVARGYVVFSIDNRGTGFRGRAFDDVVYRELGIAEVRDQVRGADYLKNLDYVDGNRVGVFGWSYGGYMALMSLLQSPETFAAGVAGAPVTDWALYDTHYTERYLDTPENNPEGYRLGSVFPYVDNLQAPLLLMHGMADDNVLFAHTTELMRTLQNKNKRFELMTYPGSKHSLIRGHREGVHAWESILNFFDRHLSAP